MKIKELAKESIKKHPKILAKLAEAEKYPQFKRKSKGALERDARRYLQTKRGNVELVFAKQ